MGIFYDRLWKNKTLIGIKFQYLLQFKIFIVVLHFYGQYQSHSLQYGVQTEQIIYFKIFNHIMCFYSIRLASIRIT